MRKFNIYSCRVGRIGRIGRFQKKRLNKSHKYEMAEVIESPDYCPEHADEMVLTPEDDPFVYENTPASPTERTSIDVSPSPEQEVEFDIDVEGCRPLTVEEQAVIESSVDFVHGALLCDGNKPPAKDLSTIQVQLSQVKAHFKRHGVFDLEAVLAKRGADRKQQVQCLPDPSPGRRGASWMAPPPRC